MLKALLFKDSPFHIQYFISKHCYLKCKMCNIVEANDDLTPFATEKITKIADNLVKIGAGVVLLTGGEPFMRPDIDEIVRSFKKKKLDVRMQTAGLLSQKEKMARCVEYGARDINISLDSLDEELSDYLNGRQGSWRNAMEMIAYVSRIFPRNDSVCALGCVLSPYNIHEIEPILDFATRIGWWLSLVPVHINPPENPMNFRGYDEYFCFQHDQIEQVGELIAVLKRKKKEGFTLFDSDDYLDSIVEFVASGHPSWRHKGICDSPHLYFAILPDGRFAPCCDHRFSENIFIYDNRFPEIYRSRDFRRKIAQEVTGKCPGCNFGSYPEMTLTVRSFQTFKERLLLQRKAKCFNRKILKQDEIFKIVSEIKSRYVTYQTPGKYPMRDKKKRPVAPNIPERLWNRE